MNLYIVSGLSGAGKSVALHSIEDQGGYCIDNLPIELLPHFAGEILPSLIGRYTQIGISIDARNSSRKLEQLPEHLKTLFPDKQATSFYLIFLEANQQTLIRRFGESRRPHPLSREGVSLEDAIQLEIERLSPIAAAAQVRLDTSDISIYQLREQLNAITGTDQPQLFIKLQSFGYKHGSPSDADFLFDVRCLPNPYWEPELRELSGLDQPVAQYLNQSTLTREVLGEISDYIGKTIPRFLNSERSYLTIGIGCTGGHHRSVYMVEQLGQWIQNLQDTQKKNSDNSWVHQCKINFYHRDL